MLDIIRGAFNNASAGVIANSPLSIKICIVFVLQRNNVRGIRTAG